MSCLATSRREELHSTAEDLRCQDAVYRMLTLRTDDEREDLARGISHMAMDYSNHPEVSRLREYITGKHAALVQKVLIIAGIAHEPMFLQHMIQHEGTCSSTLSQYSVDVVPPLIEGLLDGNINMEDFVVAALHAYTTL